MDWTQHHWDDLSQIWHWQHGMPCIAMYHVLECTMHCHVNLAVFWHLETATKHHTAVMGVLTPGQCWLLWCAHVGCAVHAVQWCNWFCIDSTWDWQLESVTCWHDWLFKTIGLSDRWQSSDLAKLRRTLGLLIWETQKNLSYNLLISWGGKPWADQ